MEQRETEERRTMERQNQESLDRLTAVMHIQAEHFSEHVRIEGYHEDRDVGHLFGCDRLMKIETMFGRIQMGYNPNRGRSFLFANLKTSRYDTVSSRYQREMKEYQRKAMQKGENQNRAFVSKRMNESAVLFEKADTKPWSENTVRPYYGRVSMEALKKTLPFFARQEELSRLKQVRIASRQLQEQVRENIRNGEFLKNNTVRREQMERLREQNLLEYLIQKKDAGSRYFLRKINYAFDIQKHEMFAYYKNRREQAEREAEQTNGDLPEDETDDGR